MSSEVKGEKTSLSKLIKSGETPQYKIESFHAQDMGRGGGGFSSGQKSDFVKLPISKDPSAVMGPFGGGREGEDPNAGEDFKDKLARLEKEAYEKGFEQGRKDGLALEERQMQEKGKQLEALFTEFRRLKEGFYSESEEELLKLSILIAKRVIRSEVKTDPHIIKRTIQSAYKYLVDKSRVRILINPDDMEEVKTMMPDLAAMNKGGRFQIIEDDVMGRGGCVLETGFGNINAGIDDQLWVLEKEIKDAFKSTGGEAL